MLDTDNVRKYTIKIYVGTRSACSIYDPFGLCSFVECLECENACYEIIDENGNYIKQPKESEDFNVFKGYVITLTLKVYGESFDLTKDNLLLIFKNRIGSYVLENEDGKVIEKSETKEETKSFIDGDYAIKTVGYRRYMVVKATESTPTPGLEKIFEMVLALESDNADFLGTDPLFLSKIGKVKYNEILDATIVDLRGLDSFISKIRLNLKRKK